MFGERVVLGHLEMTGGLVGRPIVLGTIDDTGFKRRIDLAHRHRRRVGAEGLHHRDPEVGLLHADLQPLEIGQFLDRLFGRVEGTGAGIVEGETDQTVRLESGENLLADRAVDRLVHVLGRAEQEWHAKDHRLLDEVVEGRRIDPVHVDDAEAGLLDRVLLSTEHAVVHDLDLDPAVAALGQQLPHVLHGLNRRIAVRVDVRRTQGDFLRLRRCAGKRQPHCDAKHACNFLHRFLLH
ncbi:hypothetical protein D9M70_454520 [compost metagenome]